MSYEAEKMAALAQDLYTVHVEREHGQLGIERLREVLKAVHSIYYGKRSPKSFPDGLLIFAPLDPEFQPLDTSGSIEISKPVELKRMGTGAVVQVLGERSLRVWPREAIDWRQLVEHAIVYLFDATDRSEGGPSEAIALPSGLREIDNPNGYPSALAPPTFWNLEEALDYYTGSLAASSTCPTLREAWARESQNRHLVLCNKPERRMRRSLAAHLRSSVRDTMSVRVDEEQNVSETEPVDIEVSWSMVGHIALIEIKWLGQSLNEAGDDLGTKYTDARAREGASQLANYLDECHERHPKHEINGYLIVFDARRRGVKTWEPGVVPKQDAWHYRDREIDYRDSIPQRQDFQSPRRLYLEPRIAM